MSCFDRLKTARTGAVALAAAVPLLLALAGCQVRPLYAETTGVVSKTALVAVKPAGNRPAQLVRNALIFDLGGGKGEPSNPAYQLNYSVALQGIGLFVTGVTDSATAGDMKATVRYTLTDIATSKVIARGARTALASYDLPSQEFTKIRSTKDAQERAARLAAQLVAADIAAALARQP